jgi:hypothetical protein
VGDLAGNVQIHEVAIYQAVKVSLIADGNVVSDRNAQVVEGRPALVRVSVTPSGGFSPRSLVAKLELGSGAQKTATLSVSGASSDGNLESTFNFSLSAEELSKSLAIAVSLHEANGKSVGAVQANVRAPTTGTLALGAEHSGKVRVRIVPFRYWYDGSGRLPDTSQAQLTAYQNIVYAMFPSTDVEISLREAVDYSGYVGPGSGWGSWLDTLCDVRMNDGVDSKIYYFGVMAPVSGWGSYGSGIAGLGNVPDASSNWARCAVGLGFTDADPYGYIMAHEVGHTMGLPHAPCGTDGDWFPYAGAKIGVWGYSLVSQKLKDPAQYRDLMSYCDPQWMSDYNFSRLFERIQWVNQSFVQKKASSRMQKLIVDVDGSVTVAGSVELPESPGRPTRVRVFDTAGAREVVGSFLPMSEAPAGIWFVPDPHASVLEVEADGMPRVTLR